jgi:hypothetical protein
MKQLFIRYASATSFFDFWCACLNLPATYFQPVQKKIKGKINSTLRFVAFPATEYDEVLSGYQPGQVVEQ